MKGEEKRTGGGTESGQVRKRGTRKEKLPVTG
jgi:hypothetical protein